MIYIFEPGQSAVIIDQDDPPSLAQLQAWVGGYLEIPGADIQTPGGIVQVVVNEEGKLRDLPLNVTATVFYHSALDADPRFAGSNSPAFDDVLVGTVVVLTAPNLLT